MATASPSAIRALLSRAAAGSDLVIADLPPALTQQAHEAVLRQPATLLVLTAELEPGSIQPAEKLKQMALAAGVPVRVLCNKLNVRAVSHATLLALKGAHGDRVSDILIKDATVAPESIMRGLPVTLYKPKAPTSLALFAFARELAEEGLV